jgi:hypothetical protein
MLVSQVQRLGAVVVLMASITLYGIFLYHSRQPMTLEAPLPWGDQGKDLIAVEVICTHGRGGIYFLPEKTTTQQILEMARMPKIESRIQIINAGISSGSSLMTAPSGEWIIGDMPAARKMALGLPLDLNRASEEDLSLVPGIGEKIAFQIIQLRTKQGEFRYLSDLMAVPGIKEKKIQDIEAYLNIKEGY